MEDKTKVIIVLILLAVGAWFGWQWFAGTAKDSSDAQLIKDYRIGNPIWPANKEAEARVVSGKLTQAELQNKAQSPDEHERAVAFRLMAWLPGHREAAFKFIDASWGKNNNAEVRKQIIYTLLEFGRDGMHEVLQFLSLKAVNDPDQTIEAEASSALKELTGLSLHKKEEWREWGKQQTRFKIPADKIRKKAA